MAAQTPIWKDPSPDTAPFNPWHMTTYRGYACEVVPTSYRHDWIGWYVGLVDEHGRHYAPAREGRATTIEDAKAAAIAYVDGLIERLLEAGATPRPEDRPSQAWWDLR